jgi:hypothetical protein
MPRVTCRCGEILNVPAVGPEQIVCPRCSARIRVRRPAAPRGDSDGFIRFACPCGRRLKVRVEAEMPEAGKCSDCGRVVPIPAASTQPGSSQTLPTGHPEALTEELDAADLALLERWKQSFQSAHTAVAPDAAETVPLAPVAAPPAPIPAEVKLEAGLRICPRCSKPVHLSAVVCRECGAHVPKR